MTRQRIGLLAVLCAFLFTHAAAAHTVTGPDVSVDRSGSGLISFDLDISRLGTTTTASVFTDGATGIATFNMILNNLTPCCLWKRVEIELTDGAEFATIGEVTDGGSTSFPNITSTATTATISFAPDEAATVAGVVFGDPLATLGTLDWQIERTSIPASNFDIVVRVIPEPGTALLMGLGLTALAIRRRA